MRVLYTNWGDSYTIYLENERSGNTKKVEHRIRHILLILIMFCCLLCWPRFVSAKPPKQKLNSVVALWFVLTVMQLLRMWAAASTFLERGWLLNQKLLWIEQRGEHTPRVCSHPVTSLMHKGTSCYPVTGVVNVCVSPRDVRDVQEMSQETCIPLVRNPKRHKSIKTIQS